jgi:tRNA-binding protein
METITWNDFEKVTMRIGTIIEVKPFVVAKKPAYQLLIDFGEFGIKKSSAQITQHYDENSLIGKQIIAVTNFPIKQIANFFSEVLVLGGVLDDKSVILISPDKKIPNGTIIA